MATAIRIFFSDTGRAVPGDVYGNVLFRNPGSTNHRLRVKLVGSKTNRAAIGARIKAVVARTGQATAHHPTSGIQWWVIRRIQL